MDTCRIRGGNIIIRSPFYVMVGAKLERLFFSTSLQSKARQKNYWVGKCTGDPNIALKRGKSVMFSTILLADTVYS